MNSETKNISRADDNAIGLPSPILEVLVGSTLYGTSVDDGLEDLDLMAIVVERPREFVGFSPTDTWVHRTKPQGVRSEAGDTDLTVYGLRKFLHLALKGNPTILLALFAPMEFVRRYDVRGMELQALHPQIISKLVHAPFRGYMRQQHERLLGLRGQRNVTRPELVERYGYDTKYAGHIIRLGLQGEELLLTGKLTLPMPPEQRALVVSVRTGAYTLAGVSELIIDAERRIESAMQKTKLPEKPDRRYVEAWMLRTYLSAWRTYDAAAINEGTRQHVGDQKDADVDAGNSGAMKP